MRIRLARMKLAHLIRTSEDADDITIAISAIHIAEKACEEGRYDVVPTVLSLVRTRANRADKKAEASFQNHMQLFDTRRDQLLRDTFDSDKMQEDVDKILDAMKVMMLAKDANPVIIMQVGYEQLLTLS